MKYNSRQVLIPWVGKDENGSDVRYASRMKFVGDVDHRRIKREVRKFFKRVLGRNVHPIELNNILRFTAIPLYETN